MNNLRELAEDSRYETIKIRMVLTPFPCCFEFPEAMRETTPRSVLKAVEGIRILRFVTPPVPGDVIQFRSFRWKVLGRFHEDVKVKGSPLKDKMPIVITEFIGAVAE
jgi:hypothetical protein